MVVVVIPRHGNDDDDVDDNDNATNTGDEIRPRAAQRDDQRRSTIVRQRGSDSKAQSPCFGCRRRGARRTEARHTPEPLPPRAPRRRLPQRLHPRAERAAVVPQSVACLVAPPTGLFGNDRAVGEAVGLRLSPPIAVVESDKDVSSTDVIALAPLAAPSLCTPVWLRPRSSLFVYVTARGAIARYVPTR